MRVFCEKMLLLTTSTHRFPSQPMITRGMIRDLLHFIFFEGVGVAIYLMSGLCVCASISICNMYLTGRTIDEVVLLNF